MKTLKKEGGFKPSPYYFQADFHTITSSYVSDKREVLYKREFIQFSESKKYNA